ncbi:hypothetical protein G5C51_19095 [Streptomyces sp. A7024]|uniref:Uncharacterized protein n=1 Tax=Streptomyces coryli TaxID=1128680 RepID=A0A6G4U2L8_9ACTN|nr:hypothetical protein [Streptomyces coryli]NGN65990.1 hypothetical protein [Streptomyces coryli]
MKRYGLSAALGAGLLALLSANVSAGAEPADGNSRCRPSLQILDGAGTVRGLGPRGLAAGDGVYWRGTQQHRIPLPAESERAVTAGMNKYGLIVGTIDGRHGFTYRPGATAVKLLPGAKSAGAVNDIGHVVGLTDDGDLGVWRHARLLRTLPLPEGYEDFAAHRAVDINNRGSVIGTILGPPPANGWPRPTHEVLWPADGSSPVPLADRLAPEETTPWTEAISDSGRIVGGQNPNLQPQPGRPVVFDPPYAGWPTLLEAEEGFPLDGPASMTDISPGGALAVGNADEFTAVGSWRPFAWNGSGPVRALPVLPGQTWPQARAEVADDRGRAGGSATDAEGVSHPVIWHCAVPQG